MKGVYELSQVCKHSNLPELQVPDVAFMTMLMNALKFSINIDIINDGCLNVSVSGSVGQHSYVDVKMVCLFALSLASAAHVNLLNMPVAQGLIRADHDGQKSA